MLLAITPAILASLGLNLGDIAELGSASVHFGRGAERTLKVVALDPTKGRADDMNRDLLSAEAMADRMRCSRANVYDREKKGTLFSVLPPGRENGRQYPAFQLHHALDAGLLAELILRYREHGAPTSVLWDFLRSVNPAFGGLTPVEALTGARPDRPGMQSQVIDELFALAPQERRAFVMDHALEGLSHATA